MNYLLDFTQLRRKIYKNKYENLRKYVYYVIKKDILFNSKWHLIRNRIFTYCRICGPLLLPKCKRNKYEMYSINKTGSIRGNSSQLLSSINSSFLSNDEYSSENSGLKERLLPYNNIPIKRSIFINKNEVLAKHKNMLKNNENDKNENLYITEGAEPFTFSKYGINNMKYKTLKKLEGIRNRYIINKTVIKYDNQLDIDANIKTYKNLEIEALDNYTYLSTDSIINKINTINSNSSKIIFNIFVNVILILFLILVNFGLTLSIYLYKVTKKNDYIINIFIGMIIYDFIIYLLLCLVISFFLFYSHKNKSCFSKFIFNCLIEKYIRYLYKIRLLMIKYKKDLNFIDRQ
jgi:hypothetical protein